MGRSGRPLAALALGAAVVVAACGSSNTSASSKVTTAPGGTGASTAAGGALPAAQLSLVAYSTPQAAYDQIIKAFQATPQGRDITFTESFGASGDQSRAVEAGLAADVVAFSLEPDMARLVKDGIVATDWNAGVHGGMVTASVAVIAVRKGNPKSIQTWADLTRSGTQVITPNPFTSGGARWNVIAAYGAASDDQSVAPAADQQITLLLTGISGGVPGDTHAVDAPPGAISGATVTFPLPTTPPLALGPYLVRVRVDGAESLLHVDPTTRVFDGPGVVLS